MEKKNIGEKDENWNCLQYFNYRKGEVKREKESFIYLFIYSMR